MGDCGSHLSRSRLGARATISALAFSFMLLASSAATQVRPGLGDSQSRPQSSDLRASSKGAPSFCGSVWFESADPWIRTVDLTARLLTIPELVESGIAISRNAELADLSLQLVVEMDDGETKFDYLIASSSKTNLRDQISFKWPAQNYEEVIARKAARLLLAHCSAQHDNATHLSQLPQQMIKQKLVAARTMRPVVHTSWMREDVLLAALKTRPEFAEWGIKIGGINEPSDLDLVVGHVLSTLTWTFKLVDRDSGSLLDQGSAMAFHDDRAAIRIAAATVEQISARRSLPPPALGSTESHVAVYTDTPEAWVIEAMSEDLQKRFPGKMRLSIQNGSLMTADLQGHALFSIPGSSIIDFADTKSSNTLGDNIRLDDDALNGCADCFPLFLIYAPLLVTLDQFHTYPHIFEIAWKEEKTLRVASLRVSKGDYQGLLSQLELISQAEDRDSR